MALGKRSIEIVISAKNKAAQALSQIGGTLSTLQSRIAGFASQLGLAFGLGGGSALAGIKKMADDLDKLAKTSRKLGVTTEALSKLQYAAELTGVSANTLGLGLQRMTRRIAEAAQGTGEARDAIRELGLDAQELVNMSPDAAFKRIADAMSAIPNQSDRVRLAFKLFDSEGVALINTLEGGSAAIDAYGQELERLGGVISEQTARAAEDFNDQLTRINANFAALGRQAGGPALQVLNRLFEGYGVFNTQDVEAVNRQLNLLYQQLEDLQSVRISPSSNNYDSINEALRKDIEALKTRIAELIRLKGDLESREADATKRDAVLQSQREHNQKAAALEQQRTDDLKASLGERIAALKDYAQELKGQNQDIEESAKGFGDLIKELDRSIKENLIADANLDSPFLDRHIAQASSVLELYQMLGDAQRALSKGDFAEVAGLSDSALEQLEKMREDGAVANQTLLDLARAFQRLNEQAGQGTELAISTNEQDLQKAKNELKDIKANAVVKVDVDKGEIAAARRNIEAGLAGSPVTVPVEIQITMVDGVPEYSDGLPLPSGVIERESDKRGFRL